jgi:Fe-Mn family superoxide dismutase
MTIPLIGSPTRRRLLGMTLSAAAAGVLARPFIASAQGAAPFSLPPLPYDEGALAPAISSTTIGVHYGKHHKAYVDNLNKLVEGTDLAGKSLEDIAKAVRGDAGKAGVFNNAAQAWNHAFYWNSMNPKGGGAPTGMVADRINEAFGEYGKFRQEFFTAATTQFGSGWAWLAVSPEKKLQVVKTSNADTPMAQGIKCLLTCDVWEHAYYLDYQNRRADYVNAWLDKLVNWEFAAKQLAS